MKKFLGLLLASTLVLGACGSKEESKTEDKKETKAPEKDKKQEDKKSKEENNKTSEANNTQEQQNTQETVQSQEQQNVEEQTSQEQVQQNNNNSSEMHYDPEYDKPGYTGMVDANGMPQLDPNENYDPHGGAVPGEGYMNTEEQPREDAVGGPRSLREIKEDTGKGASDFTEAEKDEANAYAREH